MTTKIKISSLIYPTTLFLIVCLIFVVGEVSSEFILLPVIFVAASYFHTKRRTFYQFNLSLLVLCTSAEAIIYFYGILLLFLFAVSFIYDPSKLNKLYFDRRLSLFFLLGLFGYLATQFVEVNVFSFPLYLVSILPPLAGYFYFSTNRLDKAERNKIVLGLLVICFTQALIAFFDYIIWKGVLNVLLREATPDNVKGTFKSAPDLTFFFLLSLFLSFNFIQFKNKIIYLAVGAFVLMVAILASARFYFLVFFASYGLLISVLDFFIVHKNKLFNRTVSVLAISIVISTIVINFDDIYDGFLSVYVIGRYNNKVVFYQRALDTDNRNVFQYLMGTGPGTIGSRSSNLRAYDTLYKKAEKKNDATTRTSLPSFIPPFSSYWTRNYLADLYEEDYAEAAGFRSALLGNPFNSAVAIFFEFGVVGFILYTSIFIGFIRKSLKLINLEVLGANDRSILLGVILLSTVIYVLSFVDQSFDRPFNMFFYWAFIGLASSITADANADVKEK